MEYKKFLIKKGLSKSTIEAYLYSLSSFQKMFEEINETNLLAYKGYLIEHFKPKTVNQRIQAINSYLNFIDKDKLKIKAVKIQQKSFLENVISDADYNFMKNQLLKDNNFDWYFVVRFLAATGARISELIQFKYEHVLLGYIDIYSKGGKVRRIYIPKKLCNEAMNYYPRNGKSNGYLFTNKKGNKLTPRGVGHQLKYFAIKYGINPDVVYPHSFRHRFAKNFIEKYQDIALLADLLGHDSIETTRIYLRKTATEQKEIVDKVVTW
ncbi:MAG: site-specific integrase [Bacilli bacterium]|nr:site-specific integrase [Bacilli bacterium]